MSAGNTARSTLAAVHGDGVRALQHVLYRAAKAGPERRFHALLVFRSFGVGVAGEA